MAASLREDMCEVVFNAGSRVPIFGFKPIRTKLRVIFFDLRLTTACTETETET
jgi:hypothetical protein